MKLQFDVTPQEFGIIEEILANNLTNNCQVWVFGSRAKNSALFNSDLDLALECNHKIASKVLTQLKTDFEKSKLPYRVDVLNIGTVEPYFQEIINKKKILFPFKAKNKVPQLRFSEFSNDWNTHSIGKIGTFFSGGTPISSNREYYSGSIPFIGSGKISSESVEQYITQEALDSSSAKMVEEGDLLYALYGATSGAVALSKINGAINQAVLCIRTNENKLFLKTWLEKNKERILQTYLQGGQGNLSAQIVKSLKLNLPTKPEQQKIASFLTAIDTKIEQLSKKQALLSAYKKGVMQKIFSQTIRFKADDGSEFPEWEENKLGGIGEFKTSSVDKKIVEGQKLIQLVNYMNVYKHENINNSSIKDLMTVSANETQLNSSYLKKGDILFTPSSETPDDIGHSVVIFEDLKDTLYSYHLMRFRPKVKLDILYSHYFCNIPDVLSQISRVATGSTRFTISVGEFSKIQVSLPSLQEQTKIANFLSSIDTKIKQMNKQLDKSKEFKKALLQQMFV